METKTFVRESVRKNTGAVIYEGPSMLDGSPIVAILTYGSKNEKTGGMHQVWILSRDIDPVLATQTGADAAICGDCPHRGLATGKKAELRSCYVRVFQAPLGIWKKYQRGGYPRAAHAEIEQVCSENPNGVRLGSYGDPAALPVSLLATLTRRAKQWTGYTHAWKHGVAIQEYCMASADSEGDAIRAESEGWRAFYVSDGKQKRLHNKTMFCPASEEMGKKRTCAECGACAGTSSKFRASIIQIAAHGALAGNIKKRENLVAASSLVR